MRTVLIPLLVPKYVQESRSVPNEQNTLQRQPESVARIEGLKKASGPLEVIGATIVVPKSHRELGNPIHHARLKKVLQELVVHDPTSGFHFQDKFC